MLRQFLTGMFEVTHGIMLTLLFAGAVIMGLYVYQNRWDEVSELPVIREMTGNYQQGLQAIGGLSGLALQRYENTGAHTPDLQAGLPDLARAWKAADVLQKLRFSKSKTRQAKVFTRYIDAHAETALRDMLLHRVPASIKLAQALLESRAGQSDLARNTNNHFGIKARPNAEARQKIRERRYADLHNYEFIPVSPAIGAWRFHDDNTYDRFETYQRVADSYARHTQLLTRDCTLGNTGCYAWIWSAYLPGQEHDIREAAAGFYHRSGIAATDFFDGKTEVPYYAACAAGLKMAGYATSPTYHKKITYLIETYELWRFDLALLKAFE
jgi:flagellum-specific peptidoglycan hydrolase FlgJ